MNAAIFAVHVIFIGALALSLSAGLSELQLLGNGRTLGADSWRVMTWAVTAALFTAPVVAVSALPRRHERDTHRDQTTNR